MLTNETSIQEMSTDDFRQRLIERVKRQATDTDESTIRVQEIIKSIERLPDSRIKDLQEQEVLSMTNTRMQSNTGGLLGDLDKDGKLSGYEANRQKAIEDNMRDKKQEGGSQIQNCKKFLVKLWTLLLSFQGQVKLKDQEQEYQTLFLPDYQTENL
jgi:hypothetical protein